MSITPSYIAVGLLLALGPARLAMAQYKPPLMAVLTLRSSALDALELRELSTGLKRALVAGPIPQLDDEALRLAPPNTEIAPYLAELKGRITEARGLVAKRHLAQARSLLKDAEEFFYSKAHLIRAPRLLTEIHLLFAQVAMALGEVNEARRVLEELAVQSPKVTLDRELFSDRLIELFTSIKANVSALAPCKLEVVTDPEGAEVYLNGAHRGVTPFRDERLLAGKHLLWLDRTGYESTVTTIEIDPGEAKRVWARLPLDPLKSLHRKWNDLAVPLLAEEIDAAGRLFDVAYLVWGEVERTPTGLVVHLRLYDRARGAACRDVSSAPRADLAGLMGQMEAQAQRLLAVLGPDGAIRPEAVKLGK